MSSNVEIISSIKELFIAEANILESNVDLPLLFHKFKLIDDGYNEIGQLFLTRTFFGAFVLYTEKNYSSDEYLELEKGYQKYIDNIPRAKYGQKLHDFFDYFFESQHEYSPDEDYYDYIDEEVSIIIMPLEPYKFTNGKLSKDDDLHRIVRKFAIEDESNIRLPDKYWTIQFEDPELYIAKTMMSAFDIIINNTDIVCYEGGEIFEEIDYSLPLTREYIESFIYKFLDDEEYKWKENEVFEYVVYVNSADKQ